MTRWFCLLLRRRNRITNMATSPKVVHDGAVLLWMSKEMLVFHYLCLAVIGAKISFHILSQSEARMRPRDLLVSVFPRLGPASQFLCFPIDSFGELEHQWRQTQRHQSPKKRAARALVDLLPVLGTKQCKLGFLQPKREVYFRQCEHSTKSCSFSAFLQRRAKRSICCLPC